MTHVEAVESVLRQWQVEYRRVHRADAEYVQVRMHGEPPILIYAPEAGEPDLRDIADRLGDELCETEAYWGVRFPR